MRGWLGAAGAGRQCAPASPVRRFCAGPLNFTVRPPEIVHREPTLSRSHVPCKVGAPAAGLCVHLCNTCSGRKVRRLDPEYMILLSVLAVVAVIFVVVFRRRMWSLADEYSMVARFAGSLRHQTSFNKSTQHHQSRNREPARGDDCPNFDSRRLANSVA